MSSIAIRPGIAQGAYPERRDDHAPWADRAVHVVRGVLARWRGSSRTRLEAFVRAVEREGSELSSETDEKISVRNLVRGAETLVRLIETFDEFDR